MQRVSGLLVLCFVVPLEAFAADSASSLPPAKVRIVASATIAAIPDRAEIDVGVTTDKKTASAAVAENERRMGAVMAAVKMNLGAGDELKTDEVTVSPRYEEARHGAIVPRVVGYTVTNTVRVKVANLTSVGRILDQALQAGANTVQRIQFGLKDREAAENRALRAASAKARARAMAIAEAQGLRVGDVLSISEGETNDFEPSLYRQHAKLGVAAPPPGMQIEPGSIEVPATVTVIFGLKQR